MFLNKALFVVTAATMASCEFLEKAVYLQHGAPKALASINNYRNLHGSNLTLAQGVILDLSEKIVQTFSVDEISVLENMCAAAFPDKLQCAIIFGDDSGGKVSSRRSDDKRIPGCYCNTGSNFCYMRKNSLRCYSGDHNGICGYSSGKLTDEFYTT